MQTKCKSLSAVVFCYSDLPQALWAHQELLCCRRHFMGLDIAEGKKTTTKTDVGKAHFNDFMVCFINPLAWQWMPPHPVHGFYCKQIILYYCIHFNTLPAIKWTLLGLPLKRFQWLVVRFPANYCIILRTSSNCHRWQALSLFSWAIAVNYSKQCNAVKCGEVPWDLITKRMKTPTRLGAIKVCW